MKVGLIGGFGRIPEIIMEALIEDGYDVSFINITGIQRNSALEKEISLSSIDFEEFLNLLKNENIKYVALAGKFDKGKLLKDLTPYLRSFSSLSMGDINLLKAFQGILHEYGIQVLDLKKYIERFITKDKVYTVEKPNKEEWEDIYFGSIRAKIIADLEIGQSVIVSNRVVYAVEAIEGTNRCIDRVKDYGLYSGILVKVGRTKQDFNLEIPTIGLETVKIAYSSNIKVIAIEAGTTLFIDQKEAVAFANKNNMKIVGFTVKGER